QERRLNARFVDRAPLRKCVTAIDTPAGKIDTDVAAVEVGNPVAEREAVPDGRAPWGGFRDPAEYGNLMTLRMKVARKDLTDLSASARYDYAHDGSSRYFGQSGDSAICLRTTIRSCSRPRM